MMKHLLLAALSLAALESTAQKPAAKPSAPNALAPIRLNNQEDSVSYAIGFLVANFYRGQGVEKLNMDVVNRAIQDVYRDRKTPLDEKQSNFVIMKRLNPDPELISVIEEGERFLAKNKKRKEIKTTASGLQYEILRPGTGPRPTADTDSVTVNYRGTLVNGTIFDANDGLSFAINGVIPGWTEGLQLMNTGAKYRFYLPYDLAYGITHQEHIPGGSALIFEVELLRTWKPLSK